MGAHISLLVVIATACATACFMIALMHLMIWVRSGRQMTYLMSSVMVIAAGFVAIIDLLQILSPDKSVFVFASRAMHVALFVLLISLMAFVRKYLQTGPVWLIYAVALLWSITVLQSMVLPDGVVHAEITELASAETPWGEVFYTPVGPVNPGKYVADVAVVLMLVFLGMAVVEASRRGQRDRAMLVGGSGAIFLLVAVTMANLQDSGILAIPLIIPLAFMIVIAALTYKLVDEAFEARSANLEIARLRRALTLGEMIGGLTHEVTQPLAAILSNAQAARRFLAESGVDLDEIREIVDDIIADDKRASRIIHSFRDLLQNRAGTDTSADVHACVRQACQLVNGECQANDVTLHIDLQPEYGPVLADPLELQQVLMNLLLNAIRAAAAGDARSRQVWIGCVESGRIAEFRVVDNGPGIDSEISDELFEPFVSNSEGGLGIGLTISRRIVERYGGRIWVEQPEGGGAVFRFTLPLSNRAGGT